MFVVVGEALADLIGERGGRTLAVYPGGSPANVALGLARLGSPVTLKTRLGRDALGAMIRAHLEASGVRVDAGPDEAQVSTSLAIASVAAGIASYDFRIDWDVRTLAPLPIEARCMHTGSLATVLPPGRAHVVDLMEREHERGRVTVSYDPNVRPALMGAATQARADVERLVALSDVVKVSDDDLHWLYPDRSDEDVARDWLGRGPALVVVTRGDAGVYAISARGELRRPAIAVDLVDTVGAGDSFTAGLLDGLRRADLLGAARGDAVRRRRRGGFGRRDHLLATGRRPAHPFRGRRGLPGQATGMTPNAPSIDRPRASCARSGSGASLGSCFGLDEAEVLDAPNLSAS